MRKWGRGVLATRSCAGGTLIGSGDRRRAHIHCHGQSIWEFPCSREDAVNLAYNNCILVCMSVDMSLDSFENIFVSQMQEQDIA